ncbi:hypothetical protein PHLCEN_2v5320 [Hermanssonia centrifuga]|uniref:FMN-dependent dehydrogenase domain-containing protein n=1 Tax=Hermanssonia centrifuga TaxID=98765 RepID=A0A2R6P5K5_9APHY|nr:hypothetical protein PHLCEN_2v5320 [Hermanssonia centrifuga]
MGRAFLYAQSVSIPCLRSCDISKRMTISSQAYGAAGVVKTVRILEREMLTGMRMLGARTVNDLRPEMVERVDWQPIMPKL